MMIIGVFSLQNNGKMLQMSLSLRKATADSVILDCKNQKMSELCFKNKYCGISYGTVLNLTVYHGIYST